MLRDPPNPTAEYTKLLTYINYGLTKHSIVFVHGLQGHPRRTWSCKANADSSEEGSGSATRKTSPFRGFKKIISRKKAIESESWSRSDTEVFWPLDLLPEDCPNVRLLTWGYESSITRFFGGPANQNTIFAHARDLLYALGIERQSCVSSLWNITEPRLTITKRMRSLIFVVHSLGGKSCLDT